VHAGEAVETPDGFIGSAVNLASRIQKLAAPNEIFVSREFRADIGAAYQTRPVGEHPLKGVGDPVEVFRLR
jgi:adenylate cyclase